MCFTILLEPYTKTKTTINVRKIYKKLVTKKYFILLKYS